MTTPSTDWRPGLPIRPGLYWLLVPGVYGMAARLYAAESMRYDDGARRLGWRQLWPITGLVDSDAPSGVEGWQPCPEPLVSAPTWHDPGEEGAV